MSLATRQFTLWPLIVACQRSRPYSNGCNPAVDASPAIIFNAHIENCYGLNAYDIQVLRDAKAKNNSADARRTVAVPMTRGVVVPLAKKRKRGTPSPRHIFLKQTRQKEAVAYCRTSGELTH